ncbi:hypothetical protein NET03_03575 [Thermomicrobium sp. CFH 73360]|uniref:hypothetical protein n=1 Tax=Thermomicrobium sp. CFH 73360 TaxID=2951987 RepID=UPI00207692A1|nr:hypothetical protein [Thermomicrobium sp. CFH 73360]MCM8745604.1 hypothetical protein [Thermomicrobium sp. CFH 73360]
MGEKPLDSGIPPSRETLTAEMTQTAFQRRVVTHLNPDEVLERAIAFFSTRGYRAGRTGRPNQVYVIGKREGVLPRVTAEILVQPNVGRRRATLVTVSGFGPQLREHLAAFVQELRRERRLS